MTKKDDKYSNEKSTKKKDGFADFDAFLSLRKIKKEIKKNYEEDDKYTISEKELFQYAKVYVRRKRRKINFLKLLILLIVLFNFVGVVQHEQNLGYRTDLFSECIMTNSLLGFTYLAILLVDFYKRKKYNTSDTIRDFVQKDLSLLCKDYGYIKEK